MAKKGGSQTTTQKLDPQTEAMQRDVYNRARQASQQPYTPYQGQTVASASPLSAQAAQQYQQLGGLAGLGGAAMAGDPNALGAFFNPYQSNVINAVGQQYDTLRGQAHLDANDAATRAGAFGGSRHGIAEGARLGQLDQGQAQTTANLLQSGFNDAQQRALQAANFGMGALGQQFGAGDYFRNIQQQYLGDQQNRFNEARDWDVRNLGILQSGLSGTPYGQSQSQPVTSNIAAGALGGALTGSQIGSVIPGIGTGIGAAIGGGLGLLGI